LSSTPVISSAKAVQVIAGSPPRAARRARSAAWHPGSELVELPALTKA
jgi:hypothetical protein